MARPRLIDDEKILQEAYALIMERGPAKLTFESLGARVGLVPSALIKRFKNKQQLLQRVDQYALEQTTTQSQQVLDATQSPLDAIIAQFTTELRFATSIERFANGQEFLLSDLRHKEQYQNYRASFLQRHQQIVTLLQAAESTRTLQPIADYDTLARHLQLIAHGAGHVWAMTQEGSIEDYIADHIRFALAPYVKTSSSPS